LEGKAAQALKQRARPDNADPDTPFRTARMPVLNYIERCGGVKPRCILASMLPSAA
jgi:hypothetical protein